MTANRDALESLRSEVTDTESVIDSALLLITGLVNRLTTALHGDDLSGQISNLRDELDSAQHKLATAVAENTVAAEDSDASYDPAPIEPLSPENTQNSGFGNDPTTGADQGGADDGSSGEASAPESGDSSEVAADQGTASDSTSSEPTGESESTDSDPVEADVAENLGDTSSLPTVDDAVEANNDGESAGDDTPTAA